MKRVRGWSAFVVSHPFDRKKSKGWGTGDLFSPVSQITFWPQNEVFREIGAMKRNSVLSISHLF